METINVINVGGVDKEIEDTVARNTNTTQSSQIQTLTSNLITTNSNLASEASARTSAEALINTRIDEIVAPTGEAPNPAEITDARVGANGTTYNNLGTAIRTQFEDVYDEVLYIHNNYDGMTEIIPATYNDGKYIRYDNAIISSESWHYTSPIFLNSGQTILVKARGAINNVSIVTKTDSTDSSHECLVRSIDSVYRWYKIFINEDGYYNFCSNKDSNLIILSQNVAPDITEPINITLTEGKFINADGNVGTAASFSYSAPVYLSKRTRILCKFHGTLDNVAYVSETDATGTSYNTLLVSKGSDNQTFIFTIPHDGYYAFSSRTDTFYLFKILAVDNYLLSVFDCLNIQESKYTIVNGKYIGTEAQIASHNSFFYTQMYLTKGTCINIITDGYGSNVSVISRCNEHNTTRFSLISGNNHGIQLYSYDVMEDGYYLICGQKSYYKIFTTYNNKRNNSKDISLALFERIGVIGDSYASGELYYDGHFHDKYEISWLQQIARRNGIIGTNYSGGGLTTRTWLTDSRGLAKLNNTTPDNLYIIGLGINDSNSSNLQPLGDLTDITDYSDPSQYADTFYGNYGKIIEAIKAHAPHAKIILMTFIASDDTREAWNDAIREIGNYYRISVATLQYNDFYTKEIYTEMSGGHPTAIGYSLMSLAYEDILSDVIARDRWRYQDYLMY